MPPLKRGESFATGMVRPRTTALFFDKLWVHPALMEGNLKGTMRAYAVPAELCVSNPLGSRQYFLAYSYNIGMYSWDEKKSDMDNYLIADLRMPEVGDVLPASSSVGSLFNIFQHDSLEEFGYREDHDYQPSRYIDSFYREPSTKYRNKAIHEIVKMYDEQKVKLTAIYLHPTEYDEVTLPQTPGLEVCLDFIPVILDAKLTWEQVLEFRKDKNAREKLDRLRRWFTIDLLTKSEEEIKSTLGKRLDDYNWALKKHGVQTVIGGLTSMLSFIAAPTALQLLTQSPLAATLSGLAIGSGAIAWVINKAIERLEVQRDEVAYIYEVRKLKT